MELKVGSVKVNITPPLSIPYLGFEPRQGRFKGVHDPLFARALVLDDGETRLAIISTDSIGYGNEILGEGRNFTALVRGNINHRTGIKPSNIMLAATHAHSTPETLGITRLLDAPGALPWLEVLIDQLASVVEMASNNMVPARLKLAKGVVETISRNRRAGNMPIKDQIEKGLIDPQVGVLFLERLDNEESFVIVNFACHPVTVQVQPFVSADYPGVMTDLIERSVIGCRNCLFLQGAAGNINPMRGDTRDFADVYSYGMILAGEVLKIIGSLRAPDAPVMDPKLASKSQIIDLPIRDTESAKTDSIPGEVQVMRIGDLAIASTPGEMFVQLGLEIKDRSIAPNTFVVELANGWVGYLLEPGGFKAGGYEASPGPWTKVSEEAGQMLVDKSAELIKDLWE